MEERTRELKDAYERLQRESAKRLAAQQERIASERRAALSVFATGVAHNFNNIITGALGFADLTMRSPDLDPKNRERLGHVTHELQRAGKLVETLMHFCGRRTSGLPGCHLGEALERTVSLLEPQFAEDGIALSFDRRADPAVGVPLPDMDQLTLQLLFNAREAVRGTPRRKVEVIVDTEDDAGRLRVVDTGHGIATDALEAYFIPFFSRRTRGVDESLPGLDAQIQGPGLGLSVCRAIVERCGGAIEVASQPGTGSTFTVRLPPAAA